MSDRFFIDTNIFVYTFDSKSPKKNRVARELVSTALAKQSGVISTQVIQEFINVALRKFSPPMSTPEANLYLNDVLYPLCEVFPDDHLYRSALEIREITGFSFYDCLIVAAGQRADCAVLYSEDLQHGQVVGTLTIQNPFR